MGYDSKVLDKVYTNWEYILSEDDKFLDLEGQMKNLYRNLKKWEIEAVFINNLNILI